MAYSVQKVRSEARSLANEAGSWTGMALQPAVEYVLLIGTNNPPEKVKARKDVSAALKHAAYGARMKVLPLLGESWGSGILHGVESVNEQLAEIGMPKVSFSDGLDSEVFDSLIKDVVRILDETPKDMIESYVAGGEEGLVKAQRRAALRVSLAIEAAIKHAQSEVVSAAVSGQGLFKEWVTHSPVPCSHCVYLASLGPIPFEDEFPDTVDGLPILSVYAKKFLGPPRHPNCLCSLKISKAG